MESFGYVSHKRRDGTLRTSLMINGYNGKEIDKVFQNVKRKRNKTREKDTTLPRITLPYIHGTTNKIANVLRKRNIRVVFSLPNSLRTMLDKAKDPIDLKHHKVVYRIPCPCGEAYIGGNGRSIAMRLKVHKAYLRYKRIKNSSIAEHSHNTKHRIFLQNSKVLTTVTNYYKRKVQDAVEIEKCGKNFNHDHGLKLKDA